MKVKLLVATIVAISIAYFGDVGGKVSLVKNLANDTFSKSEPVKVAEESKPKEFQEAENIKREAIVVPKGERATLNTIMMSVDGYEKKNSITGEFQVTSKAKEGAVFVIVKANIMNISGNSFQMFSDGMSLIDSTGAKYDPYNVSSGGAIGMMYDAFDGRDLGHNIREKGLLVYEISADAVPYAIEVEKASSTINYLFELE